MVLLYSNLRASNHPILRSDYYRHYRHSLLLTLPTKEHTGSDDMATHKAENTGDRANERVIDLPEDEIQLLIDYRVMKGTRDRRRQGALAKALGSPNTPGSLRGGQKSGDPYLQGRRDAMRELMESGGLPESQLGLEVLFLLPDSFVKFYQDLFHRALVGGSSGAVSGKGGGIDKALGHTGMVLGSETRLQAQGSGKRWKNPSSMIGSDKAMRVKQRIDKELESLVHDGTDALRSKASGTGGSSGDLTAPIQNQCRGRVEVRNGPDVGVKGCGKFLKKGWKFCPACGTEVMTRGDIAS
jgi:hypothetical protein